MNTVISGVEGYIGRRLFDYYYEKGANVFGVNRPTKYTNEEKGFKKADLFYHLATHFHNPDHPSAVETLNIMDSNIVHGEQLLKKIVGKGAKKVIYTDTYWPSFTSLYSATKHAFGEILKYYGARFGFDLITLNLFDVYGPKDKRGKIYSYIKQCVIDDFPIEIRNPFVQMFPVYIDDVINALVLAATAPQGTYNVSLISTGIFVKEVVKIYLNVLGKPKHEVIFRNGKSIGNPWPVASTLPGWKPKYSLKEGLEKMEEFSGNS